MRICGISQSVIKLPLDNTANGRLVDNKQSHIFMDFIKISSFIQGNNRPLCWIPAGACPSRISAGAGMTVW
jgi:hypothetical protein